MERKVRYLGNWGMNTFQPRTLAAFHGDPMHTRILTLATLALLGLVACKKQDDKPLTAPVEQGAPMAGAPVDSAHAGMGMGMGAKKESKVVVPDSVKGKWKSVRIAVVDKASGKETLHAVPMGTDFAVPGTGLTLRLENPLPSFSMGDGVITSKSDQMENPAIQARISEGGKEQFKGWMFAKFPDTHAFVHPKVGLRMVEFLP